MHGAQAADLFFVVHTHEVLRQLFAVDRLAHRRAPHSSACLALVVLLDLSQRVDDHPATQAQQGRSRHVGRG